MIEKEIIKEISRYLADTSYNYAVMIDGDWGCGKTFFVENSLTEAIVELEKKSEAPRKIVYVSLYGYKSILEIQDAIVIQLHFSTGKIKKSIFDKTRKREKGKNGVRTALVLAKAARDIYAPNASVFDIEEIWGDLKTNIFIFDDVERCDCPLNEVFGFINSLVEHHGAKVILVANEGEIRAKTVSEQREIQYLISANDKIAFPKSKNAWNEYEEVPLSPEELERRRKLIFPATKIDEEYKRIREKLIGVTLHFQPDTKDICRTIISNSAFPDELKQKLYGSIGHFFSTMQSAEHFNIRTFQFFISKLTNISKCIATLDIPAEYFGVITDKAISDCFSSAIDYKANLQPPEDKLARIAFSIARENRSKAIEQYVSTGELKIELLREECGRFIEENLINLIPSDDPYKQLRHSYYLNSQKWCEGNAEEIINKLENNAYPIVAYGEIIRSLLVLEAMGFDKSYLDSAIEKMVSNIAKAEHPQAPDSRFLLFEEDKDKLLRARQVLTILENAVAERNNTTRVLGIEEIIKQENWVEGLTVFAEQNNLNDNPGISVFSGVSIEEWVKLLNQAPSETLYRFREWFKRFYPTNIIWPEKPLDVDSLEMISKEIEPEESYDLIIKCHLQWIKKDIEKYCELYTSKEGR